MECIASILLAAVLFATGLAIGWSGVEKIAGFVTGRLTAADIPVPTLLPLAAAVSIGVKEWMYWYTRAAAKRIQSTSLMTGLVLAPIEAI